MLKKSWKSFALTALLCAPAHAQIFGGTGVFGTGGGTAAATPTNIVYADRVSGVNASDALDDSVAINDWIQLSRTVPQTLVFPAGTYTISNETLLFDTTNVAVKCEPGALFNYTGTRDKPAIIFGVSTTSTTLPFDCDNGSIENGTGAYTFNDDDFVGLRIIRTKWTHIGATVKYFNTNVELSGAANGIEQDIFNIVSWDAKYHLRLHVEAGGGFINENLFERLSVQMTGSFPSSQESHGVYVSKDASLSSCSVNQNVFMKPSLQLGTSIDMGVNRRLFTFDDCGAFTKVIAGRAEGGAGDAAVYLTGTEVDVANNDFEFPLYTLGEYTATLSENGYAYGNQFRSGGITFNYASTYHSGDLPSKSFTTASGLRAIKGMFVQNTNTGVEGRSDTGTVYKDCVPSNTNRGTGVWVDTNYYKDFEVLYATDGRYGRVRFAAYDANFNLLDNNSAGAPHFTGGASLTGSTAYGYSYTVASDIGERYKIHALPQVKYMKVIWTSGTTIACVKSFSITGFATENNAEALHVWGGPQASDYFWATSNPATLRGGHYLNIGDFFQNGNSGAASTLGWRVTGAGWNASNWAASTAYVVGQMANNDTGKVYVVRTAGTSAGSGGPTGTSTGITDGSVTWDYIGVVPTTEAIAANPGAATYVRLASAVTALGTTYADITGLGMSVAASTSYEFDCELLMTADAATTGIDITMNGPASPTSISYTTEGWTSTTVTASGLRTAYQVDTTFSGSQGTANRVWRMVGVLVNGSNAGTLIPQAKREAVGSGPDAGIGSYCKYRAL